IGNGNKVIHNIQFALGALNNNGDISNRNSYLGIEGGWGSFKMGTNENVYERWAYESDPFDGAAGIGGNIQMLGQSGLHGSDWFETGNGQADDNGSFWRRTEHTVWYNSPNWNGFTFEVDQTLSAYKTATVDPVITSLGAQFKPEGGRWFVNVGLETHSDSTMDLTGIGLTATEIVDATGTSVGGGFAFGPALITARFEQLEYELTDGSATVKRDHVWVGLKWTLASGYVAASIGQADELQVEGATPSPDSGSAMFAVGYYHNLSKQSQLYGVVTSIDNDPNANYGIGAGTGSTGGFGSSHTAITVGMKHTF
ncbi:MAG: porin, partial [Burkholderiales bacterium]